MHMHQPKEWNYLNKQCTWLMRHRPHSSQSWCCKGSMYRSSSSIHNHRKCIEWHWYIADNLWWCYIVCMSFRQHRSLPGSWDNWFSWDRMSIQACRWSRVRMCPWCCPKDIRIRTEDILMGYTMNNQHILSCIKNICLWEKQSTLIRIAGRLKSWHMWGSWEEVLCKVRMFGSRSSNIESYKPDIWWLGWVGNIFRNLGENMAGRCCFHPDRIHFRIEGSWWCCTWYSLDTGFGTWRNLHLISKNLSGIWCMWWNLSNWCIPHLYKSGTGM